MKLISGSTNAYLHFVAFSTADHFTRVTGLGTFNVYATATSASTGSTYGITVQEVNSTQMPGVYRLQLNDSTLMTIGSGFDAKEICLHITSSMDPVTRTFELARPIVSSGQTLALNTSGKIADVESILSKVTSIETNTTGMVTRLSSVNTNVDSALLKATSADANIALTLTKLTSVETDVDSVLTKVTSIDTNTTALIVLATSINTHVNAVQAQTTQMAFTQSGKIDSNIHYVNNVLVNGVGSTVSPWGP